MSTKMRLALCLLGASIGLAIPARAQVDRYDPTTGKYVTSDPFAQGTPSAPSPYRLNPRTTSPAAQSQATLNPPKTSPGVTASSGAPAAPSNMPVPAAATQLVPLGNMAMFDGSGASGPDPLALPDWWPQ